MDSLQSLFGLLTLTALAWSVSERREAASVRLIASGLGLQLLIAWLLLELPGARQFFLLANAGVDALGAATRAGTEFVFGYLGGAEPPFETTQAGQTFVLAFRALPLILVISALSALLFHWRILPLLVGGVARLLERSMGIGGALGLGTAANIFMGMVEAPLLIRPYLIRMTRSELFALMSCGMATIAGTVFALYAAFLAPVLPGAAGHLITASLISAPAALLVARLMVPETGTATAATLQRDELTHGAMEAITQGTVDGLRLLAYVVAMLLVMVALIHLANQLLGLLPPIGDAPLSLQTIFGWLFAPIAWLMGIPWSEAPAAGALLGIKTIINELLAYLQLAENGADDLSERSRLILAYALCGFANPGSLGIMIGGLSAMAPERRAEIVALGGKSLLAGTLATCMTGAVVGILR
ncbi:MAG: nucleoside:proton symporter [Chromatiales bacterium]|nr:nucleoside:proton symporter [Chromatiales bacterium]